MNFRTREFRDGDYVEVINDDMLVYVPKGAIGVVIGIPIDLDRADMLKIRWLYAKREDGSSVGYYFKSRFEIVPKEKIELLKLKQ